MKNETVSTLRGSSDILYAGRWRSMALFLKRVAGPSAWRKKTSAWRRRSSATRT